MEVGWIATYRNCSFKEPYLRIRCLIRFVASSREEVIVVGLSTKLADLDFSEQSTDDDTHIANYFLDKAKAKLRTESAKLAEII